MNEQLQMADGAEPIVFAPAERPPCRKCYGPWSVAGTVFCVALMTTLWLQPSHDALLCRSLLEADADRIGDALANIGISYTLRDNGSAVYVAKDKVHMARLEVVKNIPTPLRFELIDFKGATLSSANAAYTAALQSELEGTIGAISGIESARVVIETPRNRGRLDGQRPLADVIVSTAPSAKLSSEQIELIQNLVASSTDLLTPGEVTVTESQESESLAESTTQTL